MSKIRAQYAPSRSHKVRTEKALSLALYTSETSQIISIGSLPYLPYPLHSDKLEAKHRGWIQTFEKYKKNSQEIIIQKKKISFFHGQYLVSSIRYTYAVPNMPYSPNFGHTAAKMDKT